MTSPLPAVKSLGSEPLFSSRADPRASASEPLAAVAALREVASAHAAQSERLRTLAPPVVAALRNSGLLGFALPTELAGGGHGPRAQLEVIEAMARADTSTGWSLMISSMLAAIAGAYLPEDGIREVFQAQIPTCAGLLAPSGALSPVPGGYLANGRWGFASGIRHAEWTVTCTVLQAGAGSAPELRIIVVPAHQVVIEDTWHAAGLRGSGSEHYRMEDVFVPEARTFPWLKGPARRGGPAFDLPFTALLAPAHAGFALGVARAALDALASVAPARTKLWTGIAVGAHAAFHMDLGRAEAKLRAARALACEAADMLEFQSACGEPLNRQDWSLTRLSVTHATEVAAEVAKFAFHSAGASALYESSPLQRLFRDAHAAAQHIAASDDAYEFAGRVLLGIDNPHPLLMARLARADAGIDVSTTARL